MPHLPVDYSKNIIYKLVCKDINIKDCYVGHTTDFTSRKFCHKSRCNNINWEYYNLYVYKFIRENGNWENWDMIEIEKYPCNDSYEARKQERLRIEELKATLNSSIPLRTKQEWDNINKEQNKLYRELNKEILLQKASIQVTCICGATIRKDGISTHKKTLKHINFINSAVA